MSLCVDASLNYLPPLTDGLINDGLPIVWPYLATKFGTQIYRFGRS